jgi:hypothetical protein
MRWGCLVASVLALSMSVAVRGKEHQQQDVTDVLDAVAAVRGLLLLIFCGWHCAVSARIVSHGG